MANPPAKEKQFVLNAHKKDILITTVKTYLIVPTVKEPIVLIQKSAMS